MNKIVVITSMLAILAYTGSAYNFDNPDYNQLLADELEEFYFNSHLTNVRARRDAPEDEEKCPKKKHKGCCGEEVLKKFHEDNKDVKGACFKEITGKDKPDKHHGGPFDPFDCEKVQQRRNDMLCVFQCVGQKNDIIADNGDLQADKFEKYIKEKLAGFDYLVPVQDKIIKGCMQDVRNTTQSNTKCKPDGLAVDFCLFKNIQLNCPDDQIKDKQFCQKLQERLKQGRDLFGPPPPPPEN